MINKFKKKKITIITKSLQFIGNAPQNGDVINKNIHS